MKNILTLIGLCSTLLTASAAQYATNLVGTVAGGNNGFLLLTNRASVYSVELSSQYPAFVRLYDANTLAAPYYGTNYVNSAYTGVSSYPTNYVTSFVGQNGVTNWYTNTGIYTYTATVAANTNQLPAGASFVIAPNTYAIYNTDALFVKGIVAYTDTNVTMVINYR